MKTLDDGGARQQQATEERGLALDGYRYAFALTHDSHDAEDLVQEACLRVYRRKGRLRDKAYLFTTIRNLFRDICRRRGIATFDTLQDDSVEDSRHGAANVAERRLDLEAILGALGSAEREILFLNCVEGFTAAEISKMTQRPRGTILSQLARAKKKLRVAFDAKTSEESTCRGS